MMSASGRAPIKMREVGCQWLNWIPISFARRLNMFVNRLIMKKKVVMKICGI